MGERIINIQDLVVEILLHWRGIILGMFVGGIAATSFSYASFIQSSRIIQTEESRESKIIHLQNEMSQKELLETEQVLQNEETFEKWHSYLGNSVFMSLDSSQVYQADLIYTIRQNDIQTDLISTYVNLLTTNKMYQFVADRTDGFTVSDIRELVNITNIGTASNQKINSFNITILVGTEEVCTAIAESVKSYMSEVYPSIAEVYGVHDIILLQDHIAITNNASLLQKQINIYNLKSRSNYTHV